MSQTFLIIFFIAVGILAVILGRHMIMPVDESAPLNKDSALTIRGLARVSRMALMWVPSILYLTLKNCGEGLGVLFRRLAHIFDREA